MTLRSRSAWNWLRGDVREFPATYGLMAAWVLAFLATLASQAFSIPNASLLKWPTVTSATTRAWGGMSHETLAAREFWRCVLATFLHVNTLHLALNLIGLHQLGRLVENWYGGGLYLLIALLVGGLGNALAAAARDWLQPNHPWQSVGGSTLVFGLMALCAVGGRRSGTSVGASLYRLMMGLLVVNALIGLVIPGIDNFAHLSGAAMGGLIGWFDPWLIQWADRRFTRALGWTAAFLLALAVGVQIRERLVLANSQHIENRLNSLRIQWTLIRHLHDIYLAIAQRGWIPPGAWVVQSPDGRRMVIGPWRKPRGMEDLDPADLELRLSLRRLGAEERTLEIKESRSFLDPRRVEARRTFDALTARALSKPPTPEEVEEYLAAWDLLIDDFQKRFVALEAEAARWRRSLLGSRRR